MPMSFGFHSPRQILVLFLGTTLVLLVGLGWFGLRSFERDRAVTAQRVRDQLDNSADLIAAEIRQSLAETEERLTRLSLLPADAVQDAAREYAKGLGQDALVMVFEPEAVRAYPAGRLLYFPALAVSEDLSTQPFAAGEMLEFRSRDYAGAAAYFGDLARAYEGNDEMIRAGALLRLARNQRKAGELNVALLTYQKLADLGSVTIGEWPAELVARHARCDLLQQLGRSTELDLEAQRLMADLHAGRWELTRSAYLHFTTEVKEWIGGTVPLASSNATPAALSLAAGADALWANWQQDRRTQSLSSGRTNIVSHERPVFLLWRGTSDQVVALAAGPKFLEGHIVAPLRSLLERQGVSVLLADGEGRTLVPTATTTGAESESVLRTISDTRLPWMLRVVSTDFEADLAQVSTRSRLLFAGLGFLALLAAAGAYFSARAMSREIEVARLQSDFVAAVSHEFRTPLTSLRQFTDLLADDRASTAADRERYYAALRRGTRRLSHLVENLLDFGRIEADFQGFIREPLRSKEWAERVVAEFRQEVDETGYDIQFEWTGSEEALIQADAAALGRALWNLLDNAVKYSRTSRTITVKGEVNGKQLIVSVRDWGIGIPADELRQIFQKFVRGSPRLGHSVKGTGLGLALVDEIVRNHGGEVKVESTVDEGSTFSLILPVLE